MGNTNVTRTFAQLKAQQDAEFARLRGEAAARDSRRNETITRGELLDTIERVMHLRGGKALRDELELLQALRDELE